MASAASAPATRAETSALSARSLTGTSSSSSAPRGHVEQQQRAANGPLAQQRRRSLKELRAIGGGDVGKRRIEARQEIREVGTREVRRAHGLGTEAREPQFLQRARKRTGKSG
ncbi:MAG: hypothetical protein DMF88_03860 [Acidobacteria bacterium]|nr:MAG: hypothetical protein DMF88_03860 [Acidobacteriota bacterium]